MIESVVRGKERAFPKGVVPLLDKNVQEWIRSAHGSLRSFPDVDVSDSHRGASSTAAASPVKLRHGQSLVKT